MSTMESPMSSSPLGAMSAMESPMSSSLGAMGPLLRKLDSLLSPEYRLPKPLKDRIELLKEDLEEISTPLLEQSMVDSPNEMAEYWMDEVRELSYDIQDCINNMMPTHTEADYTKIRSVHRHSHRVGRVKIYRLFKTLKPCTRFAKIAELRTLVREAIERHERYQLDDCASSSSCVFTGHGRAPALYGDAANYLLGINDSRIKLIKWLTDGADKQLKVVSIVGSAGIGKTTLARQLYSELGGQFECRAFVQASRKPDMRRLLGGILSQVQRRQGPYDSCSVQNLIDNLMKHLQDKRYFIAIDDLWETTVWDIVCSAFPEDNNCSRIITMAEIEGVALDCCGYQSDNILKMKSLGYEDSQKLFFNIVFGPERPCPDQKKDVSDRIITKCAGLPLATTCVAGLLASQPNNSELWRHVQKCLCSNLSTSCTLEETLKDILKLSFNSLPHYLKTCLMYLSMYPEGYTIWKVDLVKQWIAESFVSETEGKDTEDVAGGYFDELVNRGMIQPVQINYNDEVLSCTVHHIVLDLIMHKSNEEKFITVLDYSQTIARLHSKAHRLSLQYSNAKYATKPAGITLSQVRSLAFFGILNCFPSIVEFKLLRVLMLEFWGDLHGCTSFNLTRIHRLFQLRYLKISSDIIVKLPAQMRGLQYLEILKIDARLSAVPLDIIHLPGLLHLSLRDEPNLPDGIGHIRSLRTLQYFDLGSNSEDNVLSLGKLMNLKDLHLTYSTVQSDEHLKRNLVALASSLGKLVNLKSVILTPGALGKVIYYDIFSSLSSPPINLQRLELLPPICIFSRLPEWIGQLRKLCILKIVVRELQMRDIGMLTGLPALTVLSLSVRQPTAESIIFKSGAFPVLKCLKYRCGVLCLDFQEKALPNLHKLKLGFNAHIGEQYGSMLAGIEHLPNLKEIAGRIGAAAGAEELYRSAAESAFKDAIRKNPRLPSYVNVKRVEWFEEEYEVRTQVKDSTNERHEILRKQCGGQEMEEGTKQCADSRVSHFPGPGSVFSLDRRKSDIVGGGDQFSSFSSPNTKAVPQSDHMAKDDAFKFQLHATKLLDLYDPATPDLLSLSWMHRVLDSFLICLEEFCALLACSRATAKRPLLDVLIVDFLERTIKGLDLCNTVCYGFCVIRQWHRFLAIIASALALPYPAVPLRNDKIRQAHKEFTSPDPAVLLRNDQIFRARKALTNLTICMFNQNGSSSGGGAVSQLSHSFGRWNRDGGSHGHSHGSGDQSQMSSSGSSGPDSTATFSPLLSSCSPTWSWSAARHLQAIGEGLLVPPSGFIPVTGDLGYTVHTMGAMLFVVAWALAATIPCQDHGLQMRFSVPKIPGLTQMLYERVILIQESRKEESKKSCGLLKETHQIERCSQHLMEITAAAKFPLPKEKDAEVREAAQELFQVYVSFKDGLDLLQRQVREMFRRIVRARMEILNGFASSSENKMGKESLRAPTRQRSSDAPSNSKPSELVVEAYKPEEGLVSVPKRGQIFRYLFRQYQQN